MTPLPSYLSSGASSRAHHAFLVKLHRAQSEQEEDDVIHHEVERARKELSVKGGASLTTIVDTLIILLHCTVQQQRSDIFESLEHAESFASDKPRKSSKSGNGEEWALIAALQVVERAKDIREKRIGYLYLAERLPQGHELGLMLINTIRKDLESKDPANVLLALRMIVKLPSTDLAPAVTPILTSKAFLKNSNPAIRQCALQGLMALYLSTVQPISDAFPLSMSKVVRMLSSEKDHGAICVLLRLLRTLVETESHKIQSLQEQIYLIQQLTSTLADLGVESQVILEAIRAVHAVLTYRDEAVMSDDKILDRAIEELDEALDQLLSKLPSYTGLNGAFIAEFCHLFQAEIKLPLALKRCLAIIGGILSPSSSPSIPTLPPANDHIFVLHCLAKIPLNQWDQALGPDEMESIMRGLESGDDSVRKATLKLLQASAPDVLEQTLDNYISSLTRRSDLALPLSTPPGSDPMLKIRLGMYETATRAFEVVFTREEGKEDGADAAKSIRVVFIALGGTAEYPDNASLRGMDSVWEDGKSLILAFLSDKAADYQQSFVNSLLELPGINSPTLICLRANVACEYLDKSDSEGGIEALLGDLNVAEGADVQEISLAAIAWLCKSGGDGNENIYQRISQRLGEREQGKTFSRRIDHYIEVILELTQMGVMSEVKSQSVQDILIAADKVLTRRKEIEGSFQKSSTEASHIPPPRSAGLAGGRLRYGAYDSPGSQEHRSKSNQR